MSDLGGVFRFPGVAHAYQHRPPYPAGTNKCNLFVFETLNAAGTPVQWNVRFSWSEFGNVKYPPLAGQWADQHANIPGWVVVKDPQPGDVAAMKENYSDVKYQWAEMPAGPGGKATLGFTVSYSMGVDSKNKDASWVLISYLTGPDGMNTWTEGGVANPSRILKLPGTWARKGDSVPDRPHRMARVLELPVEVSPPCSPP